MSAAVIAVARAIAAPGTGAKPGPRSGPAAFVLAIQLGWVQDRGLALADLTRAMARSQVRVIERFRIKWTKEASETPKLFLSSTGDGWLGITQPGNGSH